MPTAWRQCRGPGPSATADTLLSLHPRLAWPPQPTSQPIDGTACRSRQLAHPSEGRFIELRPGHRQTAAAHRPARVAARNGTHKQIPTDKHEHAMAVCLDVDGRERAAVGVEGRHETPTSSPAGRRSALWVGLATFGKLENGLAGPVWCQAQDCHLSASPPVVFLFETSSVLARSRSSGKSAEASSSGFFRTTTGKVPMMVRRP